MLGQERTVLWREVRLDIRPQTAVAVARATTNTGTAEHSKLQIISTRCVNIYPLSLKNPSQRSTPRLANIHRCTWSCSCEQNLHMMNLKLLLQKILGHAFLAVYQVRGFSLDDTKRMIGFHTSYKSGPYFQEVCSSGQIDPMYI